MISPLERGSLSVMSLAEIIQEIPRLTFRERQEVIRCAMIVDEARLSPSEEQLIQERLADFKRDPQAGCPLEDLKERVSRQVGQA